MSRLALAPGHAREYETIYILRPNTDRQVAGDVATRVADAIKHHEGKLTEAELWGQRRLAFPIDRHHRGTYVYLKYLGKGETVAEIERQLRLVDSVIRFQTIVLRNNVAAEGAEVEEPDFALDFDLPFEPDEPELTRERELGLDAPPPERRKRDDRGRGEEEGEGEGAKDKEGPKDKEGAKDKEGVKEGAKASEGDGTKDAEGSGEEGGES